MWQLLSAIGLLAFCAITAAAPGTVCPPPSAGDWLTLGWARAQRADVNATDDTASLSESRIGFQARPRSGFSWGLGHDYLSFEVERAEGAPLDSNGDLHRIALPLQWRGGGWRFAAAPALAVSSNALRHPGRIDADSGQLWAAAVYSRGGWRLGLCADHRFDHFRAYLTAGFEWEPGASWRLRLVYPDPSIRYRLAETWTLALFARPYGGEWRAFDDSLERSSRWRYRAWRGGLRLSWRGRDWGAHLALGRETGREVRARQGDGIDVSLDLDPATFAAIELQWRLPP